MSFRSWLTTTRLIHGILVRGPPIRHVIRAGNNFWKGCLLAMELSLLIVWFAFVPLEPQVKLRLCRRSVRACVAIKTEFNQWLLIRVVPVRLLASS
ncbi:unnamed protein product [Chondrus crispus]|uniref:Uncharacterized protein n=1 Tax=Chondrus crispus TaxID=2769 RepID=R7QFG5_CHOCR|nr:unnamed protein product [Chondrus crispus]CDF36829.1 unnamed protein product [Chondrus crispus]|eukprot:XP_005716648.1 unnamed protein product [Chondrus crispus]